MFVMMFLLAAFGATLARAENTKMEARVYFTNPADVIPQMGGLFGDLDIVQISATPQGENYLLVDTDQDQLRAIQLKGFRTEVTFKTLRDKLLKVDHWDPESDVGRNFGYFFTYYEMRDTILRLAQNYPSIVRIDSSMMSFHNHPLYCMKISDNPGSTESEPQVFINGATHAREPMGTHTCVVFATQLCKNYGVDSMTTWLVNNREIYIVPVMNPDGYIYNSDSGGTSSNWRKNRNNTSPRTGPGVDLNRNYGFKWGYNNNGSSPTPSSETYRGPSRFSEPETQAICDFLAAHRFRTCMDFHTYGRYNLCNYGYTNHYCDDSMPYIEMGDTLMANNGYTATGPIIRVLYETNGGSTEWEGGDTLIGTKFQTLAWSTEEGTTDFWYGATNPSYVDAEVALNVPNCFYLTRMAGVWLDTIAGGRIVNDTASGNGNGKLDPGETANIWFKIINRCLHPLDTAKSVTAVLRSSDTMIQVLTPSVTFLNINPRRGLSNNGASQFQFHCSPNATPGTVVNLRLEVTYSDDDVQIMQPLNYRLTIGNAPVVAHDVGVTRIIAPLGTIDSGTVVAPACSVHNYGSSTESYSVRMRIGAGYNQTASVSNHPSGTRVYVTFPNWTASPVGPIAVICSTELSGDQVPSNDRRTATDTVRAPVVHDVGCIRIVVPTGVIDSGTSIAPACSVYNFGTVAETYPVRMKVGSFYNQTATITSQAPGTALYAAFPVFSAWPRGSYVVSCSTELVTDANHANDRWLDTVNVRVLDVAAVSIDVPGDSMVLEDSIQPVAEVYNYGTDNATFQVVMTIGVWTQSRSKTLAPAARDTAGFPYWVARPLGMQAMRCSTWLAGDVIPGNNVILDSVLVWVPSGVSQSGSLPPAAFVLHPAQPNPVGEQTVIRYDLAAQAQARIEVYDARGELVRELMAAQREPGRYQVLWNRRDARDQRVAPGVYFCRMQAGGFQSTLKLLLVN
jgi:murein tripeptide amidase MpaA